MTDEIDSHGGLTALLVTYRMAIYLGGIAIVSLPLVLHSTAGVTVPVSVRAGLTVAIVGLMTATYVAERRHGGAVDTGNADDGTGKSDRPDGGYPLRTRVAVAAAVLGLAIGVFVGIEVSPTAGLLFVGGSYLFAYLAYRGDGGDR